MKVNIGTIEEMHKRFTKEALRRSKGNRKEAAKMLGISERTLYTKIKKFDLPDINKKRDD